MLKNMSLESVAEFVNGRERIPDGLVIDALADNNTEFKVLTQAGLRVGEPIPVSDVADPLVEYSSETLHPVTPRHVLGLLQRMNEKFVELRETESGLSVVQTQDGHDISAAVGGHLLNLALEANVPLRGLMGERRKPVTTVDGKSFKGAMTARLIVLRTLWESARSEWQTSRTIMNLAEEQGLSEKTTEIHLPKLIDIGIIERRKPNAMLRSERSYRGFFYRLKQENGHIPPTETVERYLGIVMLASVKDPDFINEGLDHLQRISKDRTYVSYLLKRSFAHTGHRGKLSSED